MATATVGDDVYGEDPTVNELEVRTAEILGKEAAVFVPTGTMSNQIAIRSQTEHGDLVLVDMAAHVVRSEGGAAAAVSGVTMKPLPGVHGIFAAGDVVDALGMPHRFNPKTISPRPRLLAVENTHNGGGGTVWPLDGLCAVCATGREHGLSLHLDGARLWHASAATGVAERDYAEPFDTVNVCFSKGLGAPVGSALAGSREVIERARRFKQQLGGGFRQAGIIAAGALHALEHHRGELVEDIVNARSLAQGLARLEGLSVDLERVQSNIVRFRIDALPAGDFATRCHARGVHVLPSGASGMRAVVHREVGRTEVARALGIIGDVLMEARSHS